MGMNQIPVSIIYVNWNCSAEIIRSIESVRKENGGRVLEIIVVDNNSSEDLAVFDQPGVRLIRSEVNGGFGAGCNIGARAARGEYLLLLNPDTILYNDVPAILYDFMERHPLAGAAGPMVYNEDGTLDYGAGRRWMSLTNDVLEHSTLCFRFPRLPLIGRPYYGDWDHRSTRRVECLLGACMMFRKKAFEAAGGFDEAFFLYCEEVDLCRRLDRAGWEIYYVHPAETLHRGRISTIKFYGEFDKIIRQYLASSELYFRKNFGRPYAAVWRFTIGCIYFLKYLRRRRKEDLWRARWGFRLV